MLGKFVAKLRKKHNMTQESLASELGMSRPTYSLIEHGERDLHVSEAEKLASIFGMTIENFMQQNESNVVMDITKGKKTAAVALSDIRISIPQEKLEKFKQVLLYIFKKIGGKPNVGMTVIYKILYFIDFDYYEKYEEQLMGLTYIKNHYGPTPILFKNLINDMIKNNEVEAIKSKYYQYPQTKYLVNPTIEPDLTILNGREKEHIDWELQRLSDRTANDLSDLSHKDVPWLSGETGKPLDYEATFYRTQETSVRDYHDAED